MGIDRSISFVRTLDLTLDLCEVKIESLQFEGLTWGNSCLQHNATEGATFTPVVLPLPQLPVPVSKISSSQQLHHGASTSSDTETQEVDLLAGSTYFSTWTIDAFDEQVSATLPHSASWILYTQSKSA